MQLHCLILWLSFQYLQFWSDAETEKWQSTFFRTAQTDLSWLCSDMDQTPPPHANPM